MAERLIDYKCSSLARRFRVLSNSIRNDATEWIQDCAQMLSELYYCAQQVKCVEYDNSDEFLDYWIWLGLPIKKEEVFKGKCILDDWVVLGQISEKEETLRVLKTFFYGKTSKKIGVLYEYMVAFQETSFKWTLGKHYSCSMYFYPGKMNFRIINDNVSAEKYDRWPENSSIDLKDAKAYIMQQMLDFPLTSFIPLILKA
ncbi:MAG: hypothetical protein P5693_25835, partial [Limnospira sp. PMC 1290.21]|uniref:hypothetical protein n=1 Tax=Limnospira sp. PMC 1290.21 TaxID=2981073 RepID=UPI0028E14E72